MKKLFFITCACLAATMALNAQKKDLYKPDASHLVQNNEQRFKITVDPRIELINIALTFTNLPYFGKISDEKYKYHQDVIEYFSPYKNHEAIQKCASFPYFQDISFPDQMALYLSDPPEMELKHTPPAQITKQVMDDIMQVVNLLNQFAVESKFMKFWDDHRIFYDSIIDQLQNKLPYHEYLKIVSDFFGTETTEFGCIISPILYGAAFGPTLEKDGMRIPFYVTGPDKIENGKPVFTEKWLRLLVFHEYGHSVVNPLCEKYREQIMSRDSLLQYFNNSDVIKNIYDNWFTVVHEHIVRAAENILLKKAGLESESKENLTRNLNHGFILVPALISKLEFYDLHREEYPTFEDFFPEMLKVFDENLPSLRKDESNIVSRKDAESPQPSSEIGNIESEQVKSNVADFFQYFNSKNLDSLKALIHRSVSVSKNTGDVAFLILEAATEQIPVIDNYTINKIEKENSNIKIIGKYSIGADDSDFTFYLNEEGKFIIIDMFQVNAQQK